MFTRRALILGCLIAAASLSVPAELGSVQAAELPILVIVADKTGGTSIDHGTLRAAFESDAALFQGRKLIPFNHPSGSSARVRFDEAVLELRPDQVGRFWTDQRVRTGAQPPRAVASAELLVRVIASLPGGIGYVEMAPADLPAGVRYLEVDGKGPNEAGYPLAARR